MSPGTLRYTPQPGEWHIDCTPEVAMRLKRIFPRVKQEGGRRLILQHTPEIACDLEWILHRWPFELGDETRDFLGASAASHRAKLARVEKAALTPVLPGSYDMVYPPREYQAQAAAIFLEQGHLLLGDQVGLGKTISALAALTDRRTLPAVVVVKAHLPKQWAEEIARFLPMLSTHIVKKRAEYKLPHADVYLITYSKLDAWWGILAERVRCVVYDEVQELRIPTSQKYEAAVGLSDVVPFRLGLSATPIYNYGSEIHTVMQLIAPDALGSFEEFKREWCMAGPGGKWMVTQPDVLGAYLRNNHLMLRRTRRDVGRELPPIIRYVQDASFDQAVFDKGASAADELARTILSGTFLERGQAARELDLRLRQATGIAKAPFVAELVRMLVDSGERVLLGGWHRAVYDIWRDRLRGLRVAMFTGSESPSQKEAARKAFQDGQLDVLIMSLRSGAGTNGLQFASSCCVLGEMDWSPKVHEQFIGRLARDGQEASVQVFIPVAPVGSDPTMAAILGLKEAQSVGIVDLGQDVDLDLTETDPQRVRQLAIDYLKSRGQELLIPSEEPEEVNA